LLEAARQTIEVADAARAADEHDRKVRQLRDIGQVAETIFWKTVRDTEVKLPQQKSYVDLRGRRCVIDVIAFR
jgi:hypothetical protein